ncbi:MATE family efflux transporter [Brachyspira hyodysenteriae]|uniref:MATE efflux family protein n=1 Tax=Brachyspira hyodysenteriae (strain ATCC 49526 / WA1) TaxID=565034 RepID=A0A3B6VHK4_BRAHW|nr:MATE family efflux transporter [Brachyspira hyodysenteriae]ACN84048.1 MATE efflux family protein [Brachyspira hyodysenteriae WA1]AUJ49777.1 MATE efflux family protein [Brachyspira hyodysenteriae]KLI16319.1 multidrug transporter MatE [Brachyspira hyodysenteriae]KLI18077.1 multidrug transporter MatE [Brachyspira hyodysenteriae]KLI18167.1 multidrug transporter MatE [Brachyspira hyodysenteriae]
MISFFKSQSTEARRDLILHGPITNTLIMLSIPTLIMSIVQSMIPLMDGLFLNNVAGTVIASSVHFAEPIINMMTALSQGLGVAAMAIVGQYNGLGDFKNAKRISTQIVVIGVMFGIAMGPTLYVVSILVSMNLLPNIKENVFTYLSLYSFVMPMTFLAALYNGIKNANGKPEATLIRSIILLLLKVLFNFIYVYLLHLGVVGSVLASFSTYSIVTVWMYYDLFIKKGDDQLSLKEFKFDSTVLKELMIIGVPSMLNTFLTNLGFFLINTEVEKYGASVLNGQGISNNIVNICFNFTAAFGSAVTTMVSMNIGAKYNDKARKSCYTGIIMSVITAVVLIAIIIPLTPHLTILFTREAEDLYVANKSLPIFAFGVLGFGVAMVSQGALIGLGRTRIPLIISLLRIWFLRFIFILLTSKYLSYWSVFWGNLFSNTMAGIIAFVIILRVPWVSVINLKTQNSLILRTRLFVDSLGAKLFPKNIGKRKDYVQKMRDKLSKIKDPVKLVLFREKELEKIEKMQKREERERQKEERRKLERAEWRMQLEEMKELREKKNQERKEYNENRKKEKEAKKLQMKQEVQSRREARHRLREEKKIESQKRREERMNLRNKNNNDKNN